MLFNAIGPVLAVALLAFVVWVIVKAIRSYRSDPAAYEREVEGRRESRQATSYGERAAGDP